MSSGIKWLLGLVIIIVIGVFALHWFLTYRSQQQLPVPVAQNNPPVATTTPVQANTTGLPTPPTDSSDSALAQDTTAVDTEMLGLTADLNLLNQGLSDHIIQQSY